MAAPAAGHALPGILSNPPAPVQPNVEGASREAAVRVPTVFLAKWLPVNPGARWRVFASAEGSGLPILPQEVGRA